jgi:hypothetical protein
MVNIIGEPKMRDDDQLLALERLTKLREAGTLSEDEFLKQKEKIIGEAAPVKSYRRLWLVVLLTCGIITSPLAFLILITGDVYMRNKDLSFRPLKNSTRYIYAGALVVWFVVAIANAIIHPGVLKEEITATNPKSSEQQVSAEDPLPKCDDADAIDNVKDAMQNGALSKLVQVKILDIGHEQEIYYDKIKTARYCKAQAELNTGSTAIVYKFYLGPSGAKLVLVNKDDAAFDDEIAAAKETSAEAQQAKQQPPQPPTSAVPAPQTNAPAEPQQTAKAEPSAPTDPTPAGADTEIQALAQKYVGKSYEDAESQIEALGWKEIDDTAATQDVDGAAQVFQKGNLKILVEYFPTGLAQITKISHAQ